MVGGDFRPRDLLKDLARRVRILETRNQLLNTSVEDSAGNTVLRSTMAGLEVAWGGGLKLVSDVFDGLKSAADTAWSHAESAHVGLTSTNARLNEGGDIDKRIDVTWDKAVAGANAAANAQNAANNAAAAAATARQAAHEAKAAADTIWNSALPKMSDRISELEKKVYGTGSNPGM